MKPASLQRRLLWLVLSLVVGAGLLTAMATYLDTRHELDELLDSHLAQAAALLVVQQTAEIDDDTPGLDAPTLHRYAPKVAFQVWHEGRLTLRSANAPLAPMLDSFSEVQSGFRTVRLADTQWRVFATHGAERDVQVYVGEEIASRTSILWAVLRSTLWPLAIAVPLLSVALWWAVRRGLAPLHRLGELLQLRAPEAVDPVAVRDAPAEMQPMLLALNQLLERIAALMEAERRFTADAAHELRTPIAAIRTQAQVALGETDAADRRHALLATLAGCDRATRLVDQLLTLSRLDAQAGVTFSTIDLSDLTRQVVAELASKAIAKGQNLEVDATGVQLVRGDATLLAVLVRNLVDNAVRYSPASAALRVSVQTRGRGVELTVEDAGAGMSEQAMQRLGERFFRVLGSAESGSGLGWSIVRRIAQVHDAKIRIGRSALLGGLCVQVEFPAAHEP